MAISTLWTNFAGGQSALSEKTLNVGSASGPNFSIRRKIREFTKDLIADTTGSAKSNGVIRYGETFAFGTVTFATVSGTVGAVLNGVTVTVTAAGGDVASATLFTAAVNTSSDALVRDLLQASNFACTLTASTAVAGGVITIMDVVLRPVRSATANPEMGEFAIGASDTITASNIVAAVNRHNVLKEKCKATSAVGVVTLRTTDPVPPQLSTSLSGTSGFAFSGPFVAATTICVSSLLKGTSGNQVTLALSGTGVTVSGARLTGGTNGTTVIL